MRRASKTDHSLIPLFYMNMRARSEDWLDGWLTSEASSRDAIAVKRVYIDMCNGYYPDALILSQIVYYYADDKNGIQRLSIKHGGVKWLAKTYDDWWKECRVDSRQARASIKRLKALGVIETDVRRFSGNPTVHIRLIEDGFLRRLGFSLNNPMKSPSKIKKAETQDSSVSSKNVISESEGAPLCQKMSEPNGKICHNDLAKNVETLNTDKTFIDNSQIPPEDPIHNNKNNKKADFQNGDTDPALDDFGDEDWGTDLDDFTDEPIDHNPEICRQENLEGVTPQPQATNPEICHEEKQGKPIREPIDPKAAAKRLLEARKPKQETESQFSSWQNDQGVNTQGERLSQAETEQIAQDPERRPSPTVPAARNHYESSQSQNETKEIALPSKSKTPKTKSKKTTSRSTRTTKAKRDRVPWLMEDGSKHPEFVDWMRYKWALRSSGLEFRLWLKNELTGLGFDWWDEYQDWLKAPSPEVAPIMQSNEVRIVMPKRA